MKEAAKHRISGWLALSPLLVFLAVYLVSSLIASDFYKVPVASAFLVASVYAMIITGAGSAENRVKIFSAGAGNPNILMMIWIFILAGAFANTAKDIGAIESTVNFTLKLLPGNLLYAGLFIAACFISMSIGTSVGTIVALAPVASGIAVEADMNVAFVTAIVAGGAFFGDNLSFISDTTIAATRTQDCSMSDKFKVNVRIVAPAALIVALIYIILGHSVTTVPDIGEIDFVKLIPYLLVIGLALAGMNVMSVLGIGLAVNAIIGFAYGSFDWVGWLSCMGAGIAGMGELIIVTLLAGGMLELIRHNGGLDFIISGMTKRISSARGAEASIAAIVSLANFCTANNTIAIITTGQIAKDLATKYGVDPRKSASILDTFSCVIQGIIPYGAQMLMASGLAGVSAASMLPYMYYPYIMAVFAILAIIFRYPKKYSGVSARKSD